MASPAWLPQEGKPSTSQTPGSGPSPGVPFGGPSTPTTVPASVASLGASKSSGNISNDLMHEFAPAKFASAPNPVVPAPAFSYGLLPNPNTSGVPQQSTSSSIPGLPSSPASSFSYNFTQTSAGFPSNHQSHSSTPVPLGQVQGENTPSPAIMVPGQSTYPGSFVPRTAASVMPPPAPFQSGAVSNSSSFSFTANSQLNQNNQTEKSDASGAILHGSSASSSSTNSLSGSSGTTGMGGPPALVPSVSVGTSVVADSASVALQGTSMPTASAPSNPSAQQSMYPSYQSLHTIAASPQGFWLRPPPMAGIPRPPFVPYPALYPGHFPSAPGVSTLPASSLDSHPPGVSPGVSVANSMSATPANQSSTTSGLQTGLSHQGIDNRKVVQAVVPKVDGAVQNQSDVWTAHKTDTGVIYYYNALTGESTYEKPAGFKGEPDKVPVQSTPISMEHLVGTDWALVTTNDGKKYYYNSKTKVSSWQIPSEVTELRKKTEGDVPKEHLISASSTDLVMEKGSSPIHLSAPAINTGGRDATPLRMSTTSASSSALDLVKKKLQDSGVPASSSSVPVMPVTSAPELNGSKGNSDKGLQDENSKDKVKDANGEGNMSDSSSDSEDTDSGPTKEECILQFKEMLKERGVAPFSKWEKELPKIVFDPRFKAIPSHSARRSLFEHYVKTRAEEERKEKRAAQKAAVEGFKLLLDEASEDIDHNTDYVIFRKKWGSDPRFEALDRKDRELLLNERVLPLKKAAEEKARAIRTAAASSFKSMLQEKEDIDVNSRWSRVKDTLRNDPRYKSVKHEDREVLFNEYISGLRAKEEEAVRSAKLKREEEEKLKERERELRKRKEREEQEMERVRLKIRRKEAVASFQALLVETIKDPQASWTDSKFKLERDPQGRATNSDLDPSDAEKLFREHVKTLFERCARDYKALLAEVITAEAAGEETKDGKTVLNSWSTAKRLLKPDPRYNKMPRKERETLWRRYAEDILRRQKSATDPKEEKYPEAKGRSSGDAGRFPSGSRGVQERR